MSKNQGNEYDQEFNRFIRDAKNNPELLSKFYKLIYEKDFGTRGKGNDHATLMAFFKEKDYKIQKSSLKDLHRIRRDIDLTWECGGKY